MATSPFPGQTPPPTGSFESIFGTIVTGASSFLQQLQQAGVIGRQPQPGVFIPPQGFPPAQAGAGAVPVAPSTARILLFGLAGVAIAVAVVLIVRR